MLGGLIGQVVAPANGAGLAKPQAEPTRPAPDALAAPASTPAPDSVRDKARAAAEDFESVFLTQFVEQMFSGIETDGPFGGGSSEKIYRSMMSREYATGITRSGGIGIADHVYSEILKAQQVDRP